MLGSFGEVKWLGNIYIVLFCNAVFGGCASLALFNKFTARVRTAIVNRLDLTESSFCSSCHSNIVHISTSGLPSF